MKAGKIKGYVFILSMLNVQIGLSQTGQTAIMDEPSIWSNPLFLALAGVILLLLIVILVLAGVVKGAAQVKLFANRGLKGEKYMSAMLLFILLSSATGLFAQTPDVPLADTSINGLSQGIFYSLIVFICIEILVIAVLLNSIKLLLHVEKPEDATVPAEIELPSLIDKINASVAIEEEAEIMFDHEYDGIRELDNNLPPWWKYGFYATIIWALAYLIYFHVSHTGDLQIAEYNNEVKKAETEIAEYMKKAANNVDETNVTLIKDAASVEKGQQLFMDNCAACHGKKGEGQVGPNLTDDYWIHGGSIKDVFNTIKYGYPEKGMKSWKEEIAPSQIAMIASFIKSIQGTNPPNAKEKQGELYTEAAAIAPADSTARASADTLKAGK